MDELLKEMLEEVKSLKDLTKSELPLVAQEYIAAEKVKAYVDLATGLGLLLTSLSTGLYTALANSGGHDVTGAQVICGIICAITGIFGIVCTACTVGNVIDLAMQPRRMAIKAITSLISKGSN